MQASYFYSEEVLQLQSQFDSMVMLKMIHDAGFDISSKPINYTRNSYYYDLDSQLTTFYECLIRIFGDYKIDEEEYEETGGESISITLPFPQMKELQSLLSPEEESKIFQHLNQMIRTDSDYGDREMTGEVLSDCLVIKLLGYSDDNYIFIRQLLKIRNTVQELIDSKRVNLVQRLRSVLLCKIDQELQSSNVQINATISSSAALQERFLSKKTKMNREDDEVA